MSKGADADVAKLAEELRQAYADQLEGDPESAGLTALELADAWGVSIHTVHSRLRTLKAAGKLDAGKRLVDSIDDVKRPSPVYRIKE